MECTVLELSKLAMYKFYYDFVKKKCKKCILCTDTDSLCFETEEDFYKIMLKHNELFDLINFPKDRRYFCDDNKKWRNSYIGICWSKTKNVFNT